MTATTKISIPQIAPASRLAAPHFDLERARMVQTARRILRSVADVMRTVDTPSQRAINSVGRVSSSPR